MSIRQPWSPAEEALCQLLTEQGRDSAEIAATFTERGIPRTQKAISRLKARKHWHAGVVAKSDGGAHEESLPELDAIVLRKLRESRWSVEDLADALDRGPGTVREAVQRLAAGGYGIHTDERGVSLPRTPPPSEVVLPPMWDTRARVISWAACSDTHYGSRFTQKSAFKAFVQTAREEHGVEHVLISGDLTAGQGVYRGQEHEVYATGADEQVDDFVHDLPEYEGLTYIVCGGNHDYSHYRTGGVDVLRQIAQLRPDVVNAGWDAADVMLTEHAGCRMWHPSGGMPYALSYRGQKYAAQIAYQELIDVVMGTKPLPTTRMVQIGHLHVMGGPFSQGPMDVFQAGCFEGTNGYLKAKGVAPSIGGYLYEAEVTETGLLRRVTVHRYMYGEREDDYKNHRLPETERPVRVQMFAWGDLPAA